MANDRAPANDLLIVYRGPLDVSYHYLVVKQILAVKVKNLLCSLESYYT